jgi:hypothetical protein
VFSRKFNAPLAKHLSQPLLVTVVGYEITAHLYRKPTTHLSDKCHYLLPTPSLPSCHTGNTALGRASGKASLFPFCGGRSDAADGSGSAELAPRKYVNGAKIAVPDNWAVAGLTPREGVALAGRPRPAALAQAQGYSGTWDTTPAKMDNTYYKLLLNTAWRGAKAPSGGAEYASPTSGLVMTAEDLVIKNTPALAAIAREYALDNGKWLADFGRAWNKLMTADRFTGPAANACRNAALALPGRTGV